MTAAKEPNRSLLFHWVQEAITNSTAETAGHSMQSDLAHEEIDKWLGDYVTWHNEAMQEAKSQEQIELEPYPMAFGGVAWVPKGHSAPPIDKEESHP